MRYFSFSISHNAGDWYDNFPGFSFFRIILPNMGFLNNWRSKLFLWKVNCLVKQQTKNVWFYCDSLVYTEFMSRYLKESSKYCSFSSSRLRDGFDREELLPPVKLSYTSSCFNLSLDSDFPFPIIWFFSCLVESYWMNQALLIHFYWVSQSFS